MTMTVPTEATWDFIEANLEADVRRLALSKAPQNVDLKAALVQIAGRQVAVTKLPSWAAVPRLLYPVHLSMEQCTSQAVAGYKATLVREWMTDTPAFRFADLTGGFGVDCVFLSRGCGACHYNEMNAGLCGIVAVNFPLLGRSDIRITNGEASAFLEQMGPDSLDLVYLDPARRDASGHKLVSIADCSPDVAAMQDRLLEVSPRVLVKLSPMLDISKVLGELSCVSRVMAIAVEGECKELLVFLERGFDHEPLVQAVGLDGSGIPGPVLSATVSEERNTPLSMDADGTLLAPGNCLYEPDAAVMKSGLFHTLSSRWNVAQVGPDSHLFVSSEPVSGFPGRVFRIERVVPFDKRHAGAFFSEIGKANIAVRNFPLTVSELRQRFKVSDGGSHYVFATTSGTSRQKVLIDANRGQVPFTT